jgi:hypothetical protein
MREKLLPIVSMCFALVSAPRLVWLVRDNPYFGTGPEDGLYLVAAKSLVENQGLRVAVCRNEAPLAGFFPERFAHDHQRAHQ